MLKNVCLFLWEITRQITLTSVLYYDIIWLIQDGDCKSKPNLYVEVFLGMKIQGLFVHIGFFVQNF